MDGSIWTLSVQIDGKGRCSKSIKMPMLDDAVFATRLLALDEMEAVYRVREATMPGRIASAKGPKGKLDACHCCVPCILSAPGRMTRVDTRDRKGRPAPQRSHAGAGAAFSSVGGFRR